MDLLNNEVPVITLDGPSGTGKGTICHLLARQLNWNVLDSGCIYRVLAFAAQKKFIGVTEVAALVSLAYALNVRFEVNTDGHHIVVDDEDVSRLLRSEECGQLASKIAVIPEVRTALLARQRAFRRAPGLVTDGRDMGTVVFPDAVIKFYLDASAEERAKRRYFQLKEKKIDVSLAHVINELMERDERDASRRHSPLKPAENSVAIDTTGLTIEQVLGNVLQVIYKHPFFSSFAKRN